MKYDIIPPIVELEINSNIDVMRAGDAARKVAGLSDFTPIYQGIISGIAMSLADWLCRTQKPHAIEIFGVQQDHHFGLQMTCKLPWLEQVSAASVENAMRIKLDNLVDEVQLVQSPQAVLYLTVWRKTDRQAMLKVRGAT